MTTSHKAIFVDTCAGTRGIGLHNPAIAGEKVEIIEYRLYGSEGRQLDRSEYPRGYVAPRRKFAIIGNLKFEHDGLHVYHINRMWGRAD